MVEHLNKYLLRTRVLLQGTQEQPSVPEQVAEGVSAALSEPSFLQNMVSKLPLMEFEVVCPHDAPHWFGAPQSSSWAPVPLCWVLVSSPRGGST